MTGYTVDYNRDLLWFLLQEKKIDPQKAQRNE